MEFFKLLTRKESGSSSYLPMNAVFLGDSVTQGIFEIFPGKDGAMSGAFDYEAVYHSRLGEMINTVFPFIQVNVINSGMGGESAAQGLKRLERDVLSLNPGLVVVCYGLNDVMRGKDEVSSYVVSLQEIFRRLKEKQIETIFMTPNMMNTYISPLLHPDYRSIAQMTAEYQNTGMMDYYMGCAGSICRDEKIPICDCYSKWKALYGHGVDTTVLLSNHINHPTREMHRLFASSLFDMLIGREG